MKIARVSAQPNFKLFVETDDGSSGEFDVRPYLDLEVFHPLRDPLEFQKVQSGGYYVEWECGADLSADTIDAHML